MEVVVAHQGGWDEMLFVAVPVAIFAVLLWLANRRATQQVRRRQELLAERASSTETPAGAVEAETPVEPGDRGATPAPRTRAEGEPGPTDAGSGPGVDERSNPPSPPHDRVTGPDPAP